MSAGARRVEPRLDPFAFPSETTFRFLLLVAAIVGVSLFCFNWLYYEVADNAARIDRLLVCVEQQQTAIAAVRDAADLDLARAQFRACTASLERERGLFMLGGLAVLLAVAAVFLAAVPAWKRRRRRLGPLRDEDAPELAAELRALAAEAGLRRPPRFVWNPLDGSAGGIAFGLPWRRQVAFGGGLVVRRAADPERFRAVVLHELAHLRNRDVDLSYGAVAIWYAFVLVALVPFVLSLADDPGAADAFGWRLAVLVAVVYLTRNAVLRARELYADVRASTWTGGIRDVVAGLPPERHGRLRRLLSLHPTRERRLEALDRPATLFRIGPVEAFGAGLVAMLSYEEVASLVGIWESDGLPTMWWAAVAFAPLVAAVVGVGTWRATFAALAAGTRRPGSVALGLALAAGLVVGQRLSLTAGVTSEGTLLTREAAGGLWLPVVALAGVLFVRWIAACADLWLPVAVRMRSAAPTTLLAALVSGGVLTVSIGVFFLLRNTAEAFAAGTAATGDQHALVAEQVGWPGPRALWQVVMNPGVLTVAEESAVWFVLVAVWAFPLAAALVRGRGPARPWTTLDGGPVELPAPRLRLGPTIAIGAAAAVVAFAALLALRLVLRAAFAPEIRALGDWGYAFVFWSVCLGLFVQAAAGVLASTRPGPAPVLRGLLATALATVGTAGAIAVQPSLASCVETFAVRPFQQTCAWTAEAGYFRLLLEQMLAYGLLLALVGGGLVQAVRRLRAPAPQHALEPAP